MSVHNSRSFAPSREYVVPDSTKSTNPAFRPTDSVVVAGITEPGDFAHAGQTGVVVSNDFAKNRGNTYTVNFSGTKVSHILPSMLTAP